jgi:carboxyl-terminal processing protease
MLQMRLIMSVLLAIGNASVIAQPCQPANEYDEIVRVVTERFFDQTFNGLDWDARVSEHRREVECMDDAKDVANVVNGLLGELNASHTALYTAEDMHYWGLNSLFTFDSPDAYAIDFAGIWPEPQNGSWYARHVLEGSTADTAGVFAGDELIAINGAPFSPFGFSGEAVVLRVSSDGRTTRDVPMRSSKQNIMRAFVEAARASAKILTVDEKRVGYFHLWTARDAILESMNAALDDFEAMDVDAILLDYRGGYGGTSEDYLAKIKSSPFLQAVPKYFLIDGSVRSGKEMLAGIVKRDKLGTLVGSTTAGYFLGASPFRFFDDKYLLLLAIGDGTVPVVPGVGRIEGIGIAPDVFVARCLMHCSGRDLQLEKAMELIRG